MDENLPDDILKVLENLQDGNQVIVLDESNLISDLTHTSTNDPSDTSQWVEVVTHDTPLETVQVISDPNVQEESQKSLPEKSKKKPPRKKRIRNKNPTPKVWKPPPSKASNAQIVPISKLFHTEPVETTDLANPENSQSDTESGLEELPDIESTVAKRRALRETAKLTDSPLSNRIKTPVTLETSSDTTLHPVKAPTSTKLSTSDDVASSATSTEASSATMASSDSLTETSSISAKASTTKASNDSTPKEAKNTDVALTGSTLETSAEPSTVTNLSTPPSSSVSSSKSPSPPTSKTLANPNLMEKYKKVLTPEIMKSILNFQSPINSSGPCIYKLPDGTQLKVNFGTLMKQKKRHQPSVPKPKAVPDSVKTEKAEPQKISPMPSVSKKKADKPVPENSKPKTALEVKSVIETPVFKPPEQFNEAYLRNYTDEEVVANNTPNRQFNKVEIQRSRKRIRQKLHPLPKGTVCPVEPDRGEMVAIYKNKEDFLNIVVKCSECGCYHCPLCSQEGKMNVYRPAKFLNKMFIRHLMLKHWDTRVSLIHNETEYFTICCRLHHAGTIKKHLHCPCGKVFIRSDLHRRFRVHRKTVCPLTKYLHVKPKCVIRKGPPLCTINPVPEDQHRSIFDSYEEFMREASAKCSTCNKYHCLVCSVTLYNPQKQWVLNRHLKRHYQNRVTLPGREAPFFIGCRQKHSDIKRKHYHCLCGQIVKSVAKTFLIHMKKCKFVLRPTGNRDNYTHMTMIHPSNLAMSFIKPIQVRAMIPRNSMPVYSRIGEKIPPPALAMSIFDSLEELCSVIKRCYTCCTQYHCPLCPDSVYQPSSRRILAKHLLKVHYKQKVKLPSGQHSFPCYLPHEERKKSIDPKHHHCVCGYAQVKKKRFLSHTRSCKHSQTRILNPAVERLHDYLVPETQLHNIHNFPNLQQYPQTGNYNQVDEIFEPSSSEEEEAPKKAKEPEAEGEEDSNQKVDVDHNMYCQKIDHWEETLEEHLRAKSMMNAMDVPEDDFEDAGDVQFGPFDAEDEDAEILEKKKDRAFYHDIINTYQSDPVLAIFNPFDMLISQLIQCTDCCDLYHCPWCPPEIFVPNNYRNTSKHLRKHWSHRVLMIDGTFSLPCYLDHGLVLSKHYHCMCAEVVQAAPHIFYKHVKSCPYMVNLVEECKLGNQEVNAAMPAREVLYQTQNKSKLDEVVDQLEIHIKSPQKSSTSQKKKPKSKRKRKYEHKKKSKADSSEDESAVAAQSITYETPDLVIAEDGQSIRKRRRKNTVEEDDMTVYQFEDQTNVQTQNVETQEASQNIIINAVGDDLFQQGCTYDIVLPPDGVFDINSIQSMLPSGSSYVIVDK